MSFRLHEYLYFLYLKILTLSHDVPLGADYITQMTNRYFLKLLHVDIMTYICNVYVFVSLGIYIGIFCIDVISKVNFIIYLEKR